MHLKLSRRLTIVCLAVAGAAAAVLAPLAASGDPTQRLYLGMNLHLTGPNTSAGTFVASGAVAASGVAEVRDLTIIPTGSSDTGRLSGTEIYTVLPHTDTEPRGTIVTHFEGEAFPLSSPHEVGTGRFEIVSGTGSYAGLSGDGTFEIVVDMTTNEFIGTEVAGVHPLSAPALRYAQGARNEGQRGASPAVAVAGVVATAASVRRVGAAGPSRCSSRAGARRPRLSDLRPSASWCARHQEENGKVLAGEVAVDVAPAPGRVADAEPGVSWATGAVAAAGFPEGEQLPSDAELVVDQRSCERIDAVRAA